MNATQRYASQTVLDEIGVEGQQRLAKARVLVVGAGGLGSSVLLYLTAAGVGQKMHGGRIGIIDDDQVDTSNLQRQILFREKDLGQAKATAGAHHLECLNSSTQIHPMRDRLRIENVLEIFSDYDIIVDGSDNFATKFLINDAALNLGVPDVAGALSVAMPVAKSQHRHSLVPRRLLAIHPYQAPHVVAHVWRKAAGLNKSVVDILAKDFCRLADQLVLGRLLDVALYARPVGRRDVQLPGEVIHLNALRLPLLSDVGTKCHVMTQLRD